MPTHTVLEGTLTRKLLLLLMTVLLVTNLSACNPSPKNGISSTDYLSVTYSNWVTNEADGKITTQIWCFDCSTRENVKVFQFDYSTQYPLGYYDRKNRLVYYTRRIGDDTKHGDQIYVTDLSNGTETQLTDDLFAVDYIVPAQEEVFFAARPTGSQVIKLGSIDRRTHAISYWGDDDTNIEAITVDTRKEKIFISSYSETEMYYNLAHQDGPVGQNNMKLPTYTVSETDYGFRNTRELFSENMWIRTLMTTGDDLVALCDRKYNDAAPSTVDYYNLKTNARLQEEWKGERLQVGDANYSSDGKKIYSISSVGNQRGVYECNLETMKFTPLIIQDSGFINNIQIVRY
jgi:hypothetical protein